MKNAAINLNNKSVCMKVNNIFKERFPDYAGCSNIGDNITLYFKEDPELVKLDNSALYIKNGTYYIKSNYLEFFMSLRISTNNIIFKISETMIEEGNVPLFRIHDLDFNKIIKLEK